MVMALKRIIDGIAAVLIFMCAGCATYPVIGPFSMASNYMRRGERAETLDMSATGGGLKAGLDLAALAEQLRQKTGGSSGTAFAADLVGYAVAGGLLMYANNDDEGDTGVVAPQGRQDGVIKIGDDARVYGNVDTMGSDVYVGDGTEIHGHINTGGPAEEL
jgi:hypothetical protein